MKNIATAFIKAKKSFAPALKTSTNPHFKSKYADLSACLEAVDDAFLQNGIALYQETFECDNGVMVETVLLHESGEFIRCGRLHVPAVKHDAQGYGSALSYARRYSLMAACGIAPEDDDGNAASRKPQQRQTAAPVIGAKDGIGDDLPQDWKDYLHGLAQDVTEAVQRGDVPAAKDLINEAALEDDQRIYMDRHLDSKTRAALKAKP